MDKEQRYALLLSQIGQLCEGENNTTGLLANVSAAMKTTFPDEYFWVGFYLVHGDELWLGPFQGTVACMRIAYGRGVCGSSWARRESLVVPDVEAFPGHIACSSLSRSEIVVPIFGASGEVVGVIDIDSTALATFDDTDRRYLESIAKILSKPLSV